MSDENKKAEDAATTDAPAPTEADADENTKKPVMKPLFQTLKEDDNAMLSFAEGFRDKVKILFEHFDVDGDGKLNYTELAALQKATNDNDPNYTLCCKMYVMACKSLNCHPDEGLSLEGLKFTYAADGADIDVDYYKVFDKGGKPKVAKSEAPKKEEKKMDKKKDDADKVYEVGSNGVDISS